MLRSRLYSIGLIASLIFQLYDFAVPVARPVFAASFLQAGCQTFDAASYTSSSPYGYYTPVSGQDAFRFIGVSSGLTRSADQVEVDVRSGSKTGSLLATLNVNDLFVMGVHFYPDSPVSFWFRYKDGSTPSSGEVFVNVCPNLVSATTGPTSTGQPVPTRTSTPTPTRTMTPLPTSTSTPTFTPLPTRTPTHTPLPTNTPIFASNTPTRTPTSVPTFVPPTSIPATSTSTSRPPTSTSIPSTRTPAPTSTALPSSTVKPTQTAAPQPTAAPNYACNTVQINASANLPMPEVIVPSSGVFLRDGDYIQPVYATDQYLFVMVAHYHNGSPVQVGINQKLYANAVTGGSSAYTQMYIQLGGSDSRVNGRYMTVQVCNDTNPPTPTITPFPTYDPNPYNTAVAATATQNAQNAQATATSAAATASSVAATSTAQAIATATSVAATYVSGAATATAQGSQAAATVQAGINQTAQAGQSQNDMQATAQAAAATSGVATATAAALLTPTPNPCVRLSANRDNALSVDGYYGDQVISFWRQLPDHNYTGATVTFSSNQVRQYNFGNGLWGYPPNGVSYVVDGVEPYAYSSPTFFYAYICPPSGSFPPSVNQNATSTAQAATSTAQAGSLDATATAVTGNSNATSTAQAGNAYATATAAIAGTASAVPVGTPSSLPPGCVDVYGILNTYDNLYYIQYHNDGTQYGSIQFDAFSLYQSYDLAYNTWYNATNTLYYIVSGVDTYSYRSANPSFSAHLCVNDPIATPSPGGESTATPFTLRLPLVMVAARP